MQTQESYNWVGQIREEYGEDKDQKNPSSSVENREHKDKKQNCKEYVRGATIREYHVFIDLQRIEACGRESKLASRYTQERTIPSFFIRKYSVDRFIPRRVAAPLGPERTQLVSFRIERIC
jgi:hypothetical protein